MKVKRFAVLFAASFLLTACGGVEVDDNPGAGGAGGGGAVKPTHQELADANCDAFSKTGVAQVDGTADPPEVVMADGMVKAMTLGVVVEPTSLVGNATLHVEQAGRYALVVFEDPPTNFAGVSFFSELDGGPVPADYQECVACNTSCEAVSVTGSYDLAAGDYVFHIENDMYTTVRFVLAPIAAP